jgi:hypothetical protein
MRATAVRFTNVRKPTFIATLLAMAALERTRDIQRTPLAAVQASGVPINVASLNGDYAPDANLCTRIEATPCAPTRQP